MQHHNEPRPGLSINQWRKEVAHASQPETLLPSPPADMTSPRKLRSSLASTPEAQSSEYVSQTTWTSQHVITKLTADYSERCAVGPSDLYTKTPRHVPLIYGTDSRMTDDEGEKTPGQEISKMIDWSLVLDLSSSDEEKMDAAFAKLNVHERSLNQSLSYIKRSPLVVHLEIKKQQPGNSPEVHIAIWASAALKKKSWHGWDTSLPMPAITVEGHRWDWYLLMAAGKGLVRTHRLVVYA